MDEHADLERRSEDLAGDLGSAEAVEVNGELLDLRPGDRKYTNRLAIGLIKQGRHVDARPVLEQGLRVHPDDPIMRKRLEEVQRQATSRPAEKGGRKRSGGSSGAVAGWTGFDPEELVDSALSGPGREDCIRLCAASIRASEGIDPLWTAVTPIKTGRRFRVIGGIFTGVAPWRDVLTVAVPTARKDVMRLVEEAGGRMPPEPAKAVPCIELYVPRGAVGRLFEPLLSAHVEHLRLSLEAGPPTHRNKHHPGLRAHLLERADALG